MNHRRQFVRTAALGAVAASLPGLGRAEPVQQSTPAFLAGVASVRPLVDNTRAPLKAKGLA